MKKIIDEIREEILNAFQIGTTENMLIKKTINKGFSGAEVYFIELKGISSYKGNYFLKIDTSDDEFKSANKGYCFSKVATIVKKQKINDYYVMLMEIAGKSYTEYDSFYEIDTQSQRKKAVECIITNILQEETQGKSYILDGVSASELFGNHLKWKLEQNSVLIKYVNGITREKKQKM